MKRTTVVLTLLAGSAMLFSGSGSESHAQFFGRHGHHHHGFGFGPPVTVMSPVVCPPVCGMPAGAMFGPAPFGFGRHHHRHHHHRPRMFGWGAGFGCGAPLPTFYPPPTCAVPPPQPALYGPTCGLPQQTFFGPTCGLPQQTFFGPGCAMPQQTFFGPTCAMPQQTFFPPACAAPQETLYGPDCAAPGQNGYQPPAAPPAGYDDAPLYNGLQYDGPQPTFREPMFEQPVIRNPQPAPAAEPAPRSAPEAPQTFNRPTRQQPEQSPADSREPGARFVPGAIRPQIAPLDLDDQITWRSIPSRIRLRQSAPDATGRASTASAAKGSNDWLPVSDEQIVRIHQP